MKKLIFALCLLLTLSACAPATPSPSESVPPFSGDAAPVPEQPVQPEDTTAEKPMKPAPEDAVPSGQDTPEAPAEAVPEEPEQTTPPAESTSVPDDLPELPQPVYCYDSKVISSKGQVILDASEHHPLLLRDAADQQVRAIGLQDEGGNLIRLCGLNGQPLLEDLYTTEYGILGDLFWYRTQDLYQVVRMSDGTVLYQELELVLPVDGLLAVQPMFWMTRCEMLNGDGQVVRELPSGYHLKQLLPTTPKPSLLLEDRFGKQTVADLEGRPCFDRTFDAVLTAAGTHVKVRDGSTWMAVDLTSGKTVYRRNSDFLLFPGSVMVETGTRGEMSLFSFQGRQLYGSPLLYPDALNGSWITASRPTNDTYSTVILDQQGTELLVLPAEATCLSALSPNLLFYAHFLGEDTISQKGVLRDMESGRETILMEGRYLKAEKLDTTDEPLILCRGVALDGTPISHLFTMKGKELLSDVTLLDYAGGDVFVTDKGLICLDGTWLYRA